MSSDDAITSALPRHRQLYAGGHWIEPQGGYRDTWNPATGASLGPCAEANAADVDAVVMQAQAGFETWRSVKPLERAAMMRRIAQVLRDNAGELALIDAANCGNPLKEMAGDALAAAAQVEYFAGLVTEIKGETLPMGDGVVNMTVREPLGVCARIVAYNHPLMFVAGKLAPVIAAGNTAVMKAPQQAPLSTYRLMELIEDILPPGVLNIVTGGTAAGQALVAHPLVQHVALIGSVETGRAIARAAADQLKKVSLELGGKNACIIFPDADIAAAIKGAVGGMNFSWCGQSCGSTSRLFVHESVYDRVIDGVLQQVRQFQPGLPTDPATSMGALVSKDQFDKVMRYIDVAHADGARLLYGGKRATDAALANGFFVEPTIFDGVTHDMRIAREEVFGPILSILKWSDTDEMLSHVNSVDYGLTCSIWTTSLANAHRTAARVEAGYIWVNNASRHFIGAPFGGYKRSGLGREESLEELLHYTQVKNINITLAP
ncbi:MAG: aldehyde dehydrogenase family protein [Proteobacteria bacterium]|jgi:betaine-aldehyde dehydrogenase|nr:aldehyde dehydrogenase family protein [Pseudomonadota bacterium]